MDIGLNESHYVSTMNKITLTISITYFIIVGGLLLAGVEMNTPLIKYYLTSSCVITMTSLVVWFNTNVDTVTIKIAIIYYVLLFIVVNNIVYNTFIY